MLKRKGTKMRKTVRRRIEDTLLYTCAIRLDEARSRPVSRQALRQRNKLESRKPLLTHFLEVQVGKTEIHYQTWWPVSRVSVLTQYRTKRGYVRGRFKGVEDVGGLPE